VYNTLQINGTKIASQNRNRHEEAKARRDRYKRDGPDAYGNRRTARLFAPQAEKEENQEEKEESYYAGGGTASNPS